MSDGYHPVLVVPAKAKYPAVSVERHWLPDYAGKTMFRMRPSLIFCNPQKDTLRTPRWRIIIAIRILPRGRHVYAINPVEIEWTAVRAQGAGGQNVNKVATAVHLRFDIRASSLPEAVKARLVAHRDSRITADGIVIVKAQRCRSQDKNREDALARLQELVDAAAAVKIVRKATKPTRGSQRRRIDSKVKRGQVKATRGRVVP